MNKGEVKKFLNIHKGYIKKGSKKLRDILLNKGYNTTIFICKEALKEVRKENAFKDRKPIKRLFYDIETSYNIGKFWRTGYNLNIGSQDIIHERAIICVSYKWKDEDKVHTLRWDKGNDKTLVKEFIKVMNEADELVGHNIERYDNKFMMTRAIKHDILALPKYTNNDTLHIAKRHFTFSDNKLNTIAQFLGLGMKLPHTGLKMWDDIVLYDILNIGNKKERDASFDLMTDYCEQDVILTEQVFNKLKLYTEHKTHHGVILGMRKSSCPECGSTNIETVKNVVTKAGTIKWLMKCKDCGTQFFISNTEYLKLLK